MPNQKTKLRNKMWSLVLCVSILLSCMSVPAFAQTGGTLVGQIGAIGTGDTGAGTPESTGGADNEGAPESTGGADNEGAPESTGGADSETPEDNTAGTAYGQVTGSCSCGGTYINGFCPNADCADPYQTPEGEGTAEKPYQIANAGNLYWFAAQVNGRNSGFYGKLTADIVVNPGTFDKDGNYTAKNGETPRQWTPMGDDSSAYQSTFDGDGHTISGLYYSGSDDHVGLFGCIGGGATIQNVGVIDSCFQTNYRGVNLGGIVGKASADATTVTISDCSSAALLIAPTNGNTCIGGVVGSVFLNNAGTVTIQNCSNTGRLSVTSADCIPYCGGVAGYVKSLGGTVTIRNCSNTGDITATTTDSAPYCGGVAGYVNSQGGTVTIQNCSNTGRLSVTNSMANTTYGYVFCGGVVGYVYLNAGSATIQNCFNTGELSATSTATSGYVYCGGVVGDNDGGTVTNCYYLDTCASKGIGDGEGEATAMTADQFTSGEVTYLLNGGKSDENVKWKQTLNGTSYPSFTGETVYKMTNTGCTAAADRYSNTEGATFAGEHNVGDCTQNGDGTTHKEVCSLCGETVEENAPCSFENGICTACGGYEAPALVEGVYQIKNAGNLFWFAAKVNSGETSINAKLTADIDLENRAWTAIGTAEKPYTGTFDGGNFTISNFSLTVTEGNNQGFFGAVSGGTVKDLTIKGAIEITEKVNNVGGLTGYAKNGSTIENVISYVTITDSRTDVVATDSGNRIEHVGGIVASLENSSIKNSNFNGTIVLQSSSSVGGVVGIASESATVSGCTNNGSITATGNSAHIGGVAGDAQSGTTVTQCINAGDVSTTATDCVGGVVAYAYNATIKYCGNVGTVECTADGNSYIGGVLGYVRVNSTGSLTNCFNYGTVTTKSGYTDHAGAIIGWNRVLTTSNCYNNYYLENSAIQAYTDVAITATVMTASQFSSGEVAYKLNGNTNAGTWKQTIGSDSYPNFGGKDVYYGYADCTATTQGYINEPYTTAGHHYDNGFCTRCDGYEEPTLVDGYYEIDNAGKLYWFAAEVDSGERNINGKLTADIKVNNDVLVDGELNTNALVVAAFRIWTPIGRIYEYLGTFDGDGHSVSGLYFNDSDGDRVGLFGYASGTIQNIGLKDSYIRGYNYVGGIVAENWGTVTNCYNTALVIGNSTCGGVVGFNAKTVENCYNTGKVSGKKNSGGVVGYNSASAALEGADGKVVNCFNTGTVNVTDGRVGGVVGCNDTGSVTSCYSSGTVSGSYTVGAVVGENYGGTVTNCYYLTGCASVGIGSGDGEATAKAETQFASGEVTWLLNGNSSAENVVWKQTLNGTNLPSFTGGIVYYGYLSCEEGTSIEYTNNKDASPTRPDHDYDNGFCTACGGYQPCAGKGTDTEPYLIANAGNLYWFAQLASENSWQTNAKLTANIVINSGTFAADGTYTPGEGEAAGTTPRPWTPISSYGRGNTFDGDGYTISGLYYNSDADENVGLFGQLVGTVKNLGIVNCYINASHSDSRVGGVVGQNAGTVENCAVSGTVSGKVLAGGIVGWNEGSVTGCMSTGTVSSEGFAGGIVAYNRETVTNCYSTSTVSGEHLAGGIVSYNEGSTVTNCYYLLGSASSAVGGDTGTVTNVESKNLDQFKSGEVAWLLNGGKADGVWKQTLGTDDYPSFTGGTVYSGFEQCKETRLYTNDSDEASKLVETPHDYNDNGFCTKTEGETHYEPCEGEGTDANPYLIKNAGNLYWFASFVNADFGNLWANAKLTADIVINSGTFAADGTYTPGEDEAPGTTPRPWTPIGKSVGSYTGIFDGNNKYISGLYHSSSNNSVGLFAAVGGGGTVKNVGVVNCYFSGQYEVGGVVGKNDGTVTGCYNSGTISGSCYVGGVVGYNGGGTVTNCYNTGTVTGCYNSGTISGASHVGGVVGYNDGTITNCYNTGTVSDSYYVGGVVGENEGGTIKNCYYLYDSAERGIGVGDGEVTCATPEEFKSGQVTYLLNGESSAEDVVWKQTLDGTSYPGFTGEIVYYHESKGVYSNKEEIVSVTITWTSMEYTYTDGEWNPEKHDYDEGTWSAGEGGGTVTVENTGTVTMTVSLQFTSVIDKISGTFDKSRFDIEENESQSATLSLSGKLRKNSSKERIGSITVTITQKHE